MSNDRPGDRLRKGGETLRGNRPRPLTKKQLRGIDLRADGHSWDSIARELEVCTRTLDNWRKHPDWQPTLDERQQQWVEEYEAKFTRMMPRVAHTHIKLLHSDNEAIAMRAVDSAHQNHARCVREQDTKSEVQELKDMVQMLLDKLAQERAS